MKELKIVLATLFLLMVTTGGASAYDLPKNKSQLDLFIIEANIAGRCSVELTMLTSGGRQLTSAMVKRIKIKADNVGKTLNEYLVDCRARTKIYNSLVSED